MINAELSYSSDTKIIAAVIEDTYIDIMRKISPGYKTSNKLQEICLKSAVLCQNIGAEPELYVKAQQRFFWDSLDKFFPNYLCTRHSEQNYKEYIALRAPTDPNGAYTTQKEYLSDAIHNTDRSVEEILMDDHIDFSPWFRILATKQPNQKIIDKYKYRAKALMSENLTDFLQAEKLDLSRIYG